MIIVVIKFTIATNNADYLIIYFITNQLYTFVVIDLAPLTKKKKL